MAQLVRSAKISNRPVVDVFLESGELNEHSFLYQLSQNLMLPWWEPKPGWSWPRELAELIGKEEAERWQVVPFEREMFRNPASQEIHVASYQPLDDLVVQNLTRSRLSTRIRLHLSTRELVQSGLKAIYEVDGLAA